MIGKEGFLHLLFSRQIDPTTQQQQAKTALKKTQDW
jgi:hypothetical protein